MPIRSILAMLFMVVSYPVLSVTSFYGNFDSGTVTGIGNTNWKYVQRVAQDRFTIIDGGGTHPSAARVEVREGDNPLNCCNGTDRAEVLVMQKADGSELHENLSSGTQEYTISVKFDELSWPLISDITGGGKWGIFLQLHGPDNLNASPAYALSATDKIRFNMRTGLISKSGNNVEYDLTNGDVTKGSWIDFIVTIKYAIDNTGFVRVQRRDEWEADFTQVLYIPNTPTLQYSLRGKKPIVGDHYMKHGLYRNRQPFRSILYLDNFTRSPVP